jgi:outer membrane protein assembly factor BamB
MRRLALLLSVVCFFILSCRESSSGEKSSKPETPGSDWPCFLGPTHDSISTEKGIISPWPKEGLRVVWYQKVGQGYGAPTVCGDHLFIFDRQDKDARLRALDRKTGETAWTFKYPTRYVDEFGYSNGPRCCPIVDDGRVFLHGAEGMLYCVDAANGKELWKVDTFRDFNVKPNFFGVGSAPLVEGDLLIVQIGGADKDDDESPNGSAVVAFDKKSGEVKYKLGDEFAGYSSPVAATIGDRHWCFVFARGGLIAFDPKTGKQDFHFPWRAQILASVNASNPVIVEDKVFISECYGPGSALLKVKPGDYDVVWSDKRKRERDQSLKAHWVTPVYDDGYLYGDSGYRTPNATLRCIEFATGKVKWESENFGHSSLLKVDGHLICLTEDGELRLLKLNPEKYDEISRMTPQKPGKDGGRLLEHPCWAAPILSHGLLYVRGSDYLVCLELIPDKSKQE